MNSQNDTLYSFVFFCFCVEWY